MTLFYIKKKNNQTTRHLVTVHCLLVLPERNCLGAYFAGAFNAWFLHKIEQNLHETDPLQFLYNSMWTFQDEWQHGDIDDGVKRSTQAAFSCRFDNSRRLLWTNGWDPSQQNQGLKFYPGIDEITLFHRALLMTWERRRLGPKVGKNQHPPQFFSYNKSFSLHSLSTVLSVTPSHPATSSSATLSTTLIPLHRKLILFPPQWQQPISTTIFVFFLLQYRQQQQRLLHRRRHQLQGDYPDHLQPHSRLVTTTASPTSLHHLQL